MPLDDISAESLLNMILDKVDDIIIINDHEKNIIWMNRSAQVILGTSIEDAVGMKCYKLFGATCCCDNCVANHTMGGPHRCGCTFKCTNKTGEYECEPVPYYKEGKLRVVVQHIRPIDKNE
ncbi:MAG: PAS domain-containing protein [Methanomassiliicoccaceae archaeon]|nr:PAS domain-containing protein [Methanomassiliicoccaceae archaeon]